MRAVADALALPLTGASVDAVISNPPYPGNGFDAYEGAVRECQRVLKPQGRGWFLVRNPHGAEQWFTFDKETCWWAHQGAASRPVASGPGISWGAVPDRDVVPLILQYSRLGDVVLDPFAGRGGIPKLAKRLGRVAIGLDIDADQLHKGGPYG